jgi:hydrogenase maturation protein HypF
MISPHIKVTYEGQAAMEFEALARRCQCRNSHEHRLEYSIDETSDILIIETSRVIESLAQHLERGMAKECAAYSFHLTLADVIVDTLKILRERTSQSKVCLAGGVFQNSLLSQLTDRNLSALGFTVYFSDKLPSNDGGISYGQAVIGLAKIESGAVGNY